jgi:tyrosine-protein kinase Etk/Wzc
MRGGDGRPPLETRAWPADRPPGPEEEIGLDEIWAVLRRRWTWIAGALLMTLAAAAAWTWWQTPEWEASATVRVEEPEQGLGSDERTLLLGGGGNQIETEMRVLATRPIREEVAEGLDLPFRVVRPAGASRDLLFDHVEAARSVPRVAYRLTRRGEDRWRLEALPPEENDDSAAAASVEARAVAAGDTVRVADAAFVLAADSALRAIGFEPPEAIEVRTVPFRDAVAALGEAMTVTRPDPDARLIRVRYRATDRHLVRRVPDALTDAFLQRRRQVQSTEARSTASFLEEQTARIESQLEAAEEALQAFREEEQVVAPEAQAEQQVRRMAEMRARLSELESERDALSRLLRSLEGEERAAVRRLATFPTFLRNEAVQSLFESLVQARSERASMLERRTESFPEVVALGRKIDELETQLADMGSNYLSSLNGQIASLQAELARFGGEVEEVPAREVQFARLQRRTEVLTELHTMLQRRLKEAEIREAVEDPSVRVVETALLPEQPVSPRPVRNVALAGFLGLMLGVGLAFVREYTDRRIHDEEDVDRALGLPVLGRVPRLRGVNGRRPRSEGLVATGDARSLPAEAYRTLRTNVRYTRGGKGSRELVVTSPGSREGKSMTASNLAASFARQGHRTLLVDADLRQSVQHETFEVEESPGLSDLLVDGYPAERLEQVVRATRVEGLDLLPAGFAPPNPAELLDSEAMDRILEQARERYEAMVLDTPPALVVTDASVLGVRVEGVLLVVRADRTDRDAASDTLVQLRRVGCQVVGVVFNDAGDGSRHRYYDYEGYFDDGDTSRTTGGRLRRLLPFG